MDDPRCEGTKLDGGPCGAPPLPGQRFCVWHEPSMQGRVAAGRKAGGYGKSTEVRARKAMPADLRSVGDMLLAAMQAVKDGSMTPSVAHALAGLARAYVDVTEYATFEARIAAVEEATEVKAA